jgi:phosphatidylserine/phosphatidylglycerophosphate/cardiolipin synthase-like enzyme
MRKAKSRAIPLPMVYLKSWRSLARCSLRRVATAVGLVLLLLIPACGRQGLETLPALEVYFSPKGGCTEAVANEIGAARTAILVQAYSFTSAPIAKALVEARRRGVDVQVILDKSQRTEKYSSADFLLHAAIPVYIDAQHAIAHNKIMIIDGHTVITGSFNFTNAAEEHNAENLLVLRSPQLADTYAANWNAHLGHSARYEGKGEDRAEAGQRAKPAAARATSRAFVTSRNSDVFHRANCRSAEKISPKNLIGYATREEALRAGKKPCEECRP